MLITILIVVAFVLFAIPAIRALFAGSVDYTNSGLALLTATLFIPLL